MIKLNALPGPGGAPTRTTTIPDDAKARKEFPIASGVLDYFPDALTALAQISWRGNEQHNPGKSLRWDRSKSGDESDCIIRHFMQRGTIDTDGMRHTAKMAWRALALLQKEIEAEGEIFRVVENDSRKAVCCRFNNGTGRFEELLPDGTVVDLKLCNGAKVEP